MADFLGFIGARRAVPSFQRVQIGNEIASLLLILHSRKRHRGAGHQLLRRCDEGIERFIIPGDVRGLHRPAVVESWRGTRLAPCNTEEAGAGSIATVSGVSA